MLYISVFSFLLTWIWLQANSGIFPETYFDNFSDSYGIVALIGSLIGFGAFRKWGGLKSLLGRSIFLFSLGLLFQYLGQVSYAYYRMINGVDIAYPSFGEFFYFGSIPIYIYASWLLLQSFGVKKLMEKPINVLAAIIIPILMLSLGYIITLIDYVPGDYGGPIATTVGVFLDYAYPITQAILVSIAIFAYFVSRKNLGGKLMAPVMLLVMAMYGQYLADTLYTYRVLQETYYGGDYTDVIYIVTYGLVGLAFVYFNKAFKSITDGT